MRSFPVSLLGKGLVTVSWLRPCVPADHLQRSCFVRCGWRGCGFSGGAVLTGSSPTCQLTPASQHDSLFWFSFFHLYIREKEGDLRGMCKGLTIVWRDIVSTWQLTHCS